MRVCHSFRDSNPLNKQYKTKESKAFWGKMKAMQVWSTKWPIETTNNRAIKSKRGSIHISTRPSSRRWITLGERNVVHSGSLPLRNRLGDGNLQAAWSRTFRTVVPHRRLNNRKGCICTSKAVLKSNTTAWRWNNYPRACMVIGPVRRCLPRPAPRRYIVNSHQCILRRSKLIDRLRSLMPLQKHERGRESVATSSQSQNCRRPSTLLAHHHRNPIFHTHGLIQVEDMIRNNCKS